MIINIEPLISSATPLVDVRLWLLGRVARLLGVTLVERALEFAPSDQPPTTDEWFL